MSGLVLSLFPGIGLLDMAFEEHGFCVVRGPDAIWGGDIRRFHPPAQAFDGIIGGPPCQQFSPLANLVRARGHEPRFGNLIPEFERCVLEAQPAWFLMENVKQAPVPSVDGYAIKPFLLSNEELGAEQERQRRFAFGVHGNAGLAEAPDLNRWIQRAALMLPGRSRTVTQFLVNNDERVKARRPAVTAGAAIRQPAVTGRTGYSQREARGFRKPAVTGSDGGEFRKPAVTAAHGGSGRPKGGHLVRYRLPEAMRLQGLPPGHLDHCPLTMEGKMKAVANGVPLTMGRAVAAAVLAAIEWINWSREIAPSGVLGPEAPSGDGG